MHNSGTVEIDRPIEEVFHLACEHVDQWSIIVVEDTVIDKKPDGGVGTTFRTVTEERGQRMEFQGVVTRHEPPYVNAVHLSGKSFDIDTGFTFEDLSGRTRVTQTSDVHGKGFFGLFLRCCGWMMNKSSCKAQQKELDSLKNYCEEYSGPIPSDAP